MPDFSRTSSVAIRTDATVGELQLTCRLEDVTTSATSQSMAHNVRFGAGKVGRAKTESAIQCNPPPGGAHKLGYEGPISRTQQTARGKQQQNDRKINERREACDQGEVRGPVGAGEGNCSRSAR